MTSLKPIRDLPVMNGRPDPSVMSMLEVLSLKDWKGWFTTSIDQVPFVGDTLRTCVSCGCANVYIPAYEHNGKTIPAKTLPIDTTQVTGQILCRSCFETYWTYLPVGEKHPGAGAPHLSMPASQRSYEGDNFHSGEW